jgi:hypothetical protein
MKTISLVYFEADSLMRGGNGGNGGSTASTTGQGGLGSAGGLGGIGGIEWNWCYERCRRCSWHCRPKWL